MIASNHLADSAAPYPPSHKLIWPVAVFFVAAVISILDRQIMFLLVDPIRESLNINDVQVSLLEGAAFSICYATMALPIGLLVDRVTRKWIAAAGVLIWSLATVWGGFANSFEEMFLSRIFVGLGEAALAPVAISIISDMAPPEKRGKPLGFFLMGNGVGKGATIAIVGAILAAAAAPALADNPWVQSVEPWRLSFIVCGAVGVFAAGLLLTIKEPPRRTRPSATAAKTSQLGPAYRYFKDNFKMVAPFILALAILSIGNYGLAAWGPSLLIRQFGMTHQEVGGALGAALVIAGVTGAILGGTIADRASVKGGVIGRLRWNALSCLALIPGALAVFAPNAAVAIVMLASGTVAFSTFGCLHAASAQDIVPSNLRGTMVGMQVLITTVIGFVGGPLVIALMTEHLFRGPELVGYSMALTIVPAVAITFLTTIMTIRELRPRPNLPEGKIVVEAAASVPTQT